MISNLFLLISTSPPLLTLQISNYSYYSATPIPCTKKIENDNRKESVKN